MNILNFLTGGLVVWVLLGVVVAGGTRILEEVQVKGGLILSMIFGVMGAVVFGFIVKIFIGHSFSVLSIWSLLSSLIGAIIFVNLQRLLPEGGAEQKEEEAEEHQMSSQPTPL